MTEPELQKLMTQFVFLELDAGSQDFNLWISKYKPTGNGLPMVYIVSSRGKEVYNKSGAPQGAGLKNLLEKGITDTGGIKKIVAASDDPADKKNADVFQRISEIETEIADDETALEALIELLKIGRENIRNKDVRKKTGPIFGKVNRNKKQRAVLDQARYFDRADRYAVDEKKRKRAVGIYRIVIRKYTDTPAAELAQSRLDGLKIE